MSSTDERLLTLDAPFVEQEGSSQTSDTPQTRKFALTIPKSINMRIRAIQKAERRNLGVVLTKCIEDYLRDGDGESLPYLPSPLFHEDNAKLYVKGETAYEFVTDMSGQVHPPHKGADSGGK